MTTMNHHPNSNEGFFESWILGGYRWIAQIFKRISRKRKITEQMHPTLQPDGMFSWAAPGDLYPITP